MSEIYLDVCCLNRPFDDQMQDRIRLEAEAVLVILTYLESREWECIGSEVIDDEIEQTHDPERRGRLEALASFAHRKVLVEQAEVERAERLQSLGFHPVDALHIACAERGDALSFSRRTIIFLQWLPATRELRVAVENPLVWLKRMTGK